MRIWRSKMDVLATLLCMALAAYLSASYYCQGDCEGCASMGKRDVSSLPPSSSSSPSTAQPFTLFALILSSPGGRERRDAIRRTWCRDTPQDAKYRFFIGEEGLGEDVLASLRAESEQFGDLALLANFSDSYSGLTNKILASFTWAVQHMPPFAFLLKCDDDTFVRFPLMLDVLRAEPTNTKLYWGYFDGRAPVKRSGKWAEPSWVLADTYLPYALGGGYVVSSALVAHIVRVQDMLALFNSEDVSVGTWLAPLKLDRRHDTRFDTEWKTRGCQNKFLVFHKQSIESMAEMQRNLDQSQGTVPCTKEQIARPEYEYRWDLPASQCCPGRGKN